MVRLDKIGATDYTDFTKSIPGRRYNIRSILLLFLRLLLREGIMTRIAVIPGDGIGSEVTAEALKVLRTLSELSGKTIETVEFDFGAERYLRDGISLPPDALDRFRSEFDAILLGALGDPRIPDMKHATDILFGIRFGLDLYANIRPVKLLDRRLSPLKGMIESDIDFTVFRENTEDLYVGIGGLFKKDTPDEFAIQEGVTTRKGV